MPELAGGEGAAARVRGEGGVDAQVVALHDLEGERGDGERDADERGERGHRPVRHGVAHPGGGRPPEAEQAAHRREASCELLHGRVAVRSRGEREPVEHDDERRERDERDDDVDEVRMAEARGERVHAEREEGRDGGGDGGSEQHAQRRARDRPRAACHAREVDRPHRHGGDGAHEHGAGVERRHARGHHGAARNGEGHDEVEVRETEERAVGLEEREDHADERAERDREGGEGGAQAEAHEREAQHGKVECRERDEEHTGYHGERHADAARSRRERADERMHLHAHEDEEGAHGCLLLAVLGRAAGGRFAHGAGARAAVLDEFQEDLLERIVAAHLVGGSRGDDLAVADDGDLVAELLDYFEHVRREEHRAAARRELVEHALELVRDERVQADERLG